MDADSYKQLLESAEILENYTESPSLNELVLEKFRELKEASHRFLFGFKKDAQAKNFYYVQYAYIDRKAKIID